MNKKHKKGFSLVEMLVTVTVFTLLGVLTTQAIFLTLRSAGKGTSTAKIRDNVNYFLSIIQRQLRGAQSIVNCPNTNDTSYIEYINENGETSRFSCVTDSGLGYIASGSARLTSEEIDITGCSFICEEGISGNPPSVTISIIAEDPNNLSVEKGKFSSTTKIYLRNN